MKLIDIIRSHGIYTATSREFTLSGGSKSNTYIDLRWIVLSRRGFSAIGEGLTGLIDSQAESIDAICGVLTAGAFCAMSIMEMTAWSPLLFCVQRKNGDVRILGGLDFDPLDEDMRDYSEPGLRVMMIDDVITTGWSIKKDAEVLTRAGMVVVGAAVVVNRSGMDQIEISTVNRESSIIPMTTVPVYSMFRYSDESGLVEV